MWGVFLFWWCVRVCDSGEMKREKFYVSDLFGRRKWHTWWIRAGRRQGRERHEFWWCSPSKATADATRWRTIPFEHYLMSTRFVSFRFHFTSVSSHLKYALIAGILSPQHIEIDDDFWNHFLATNNNECQFDCLALAFVLIHCYCAKVECFAQFSTALSMVMMMMIATAATTKCRRFFSLFSRSHLLWQRELRW